MTDTLPERLPVGEEATDAMQRALYRRAVGYEAEEQHVILADDGSKKIIQKKHHVPGDPRAMAMYLELFGE